MCTSFYDLFPRKLGGVLLVIECLSVVYLETKGGVKTK